MPTILAVDQALQRLGWVIFRGPKPTIDAGGANFTHIEPEHRLGHVCQFVRAKLAQIDERPAILALEDVWVPPFVGRDGKRKANMRTVINLAGLRDALRAIGWSMDFEVQIVSTREWHAGCGLTGRRGQLGRATGKAASMRFAKTVSGFDHLTEDAADAICLGWYVYHEAKRAAGITAAQRLSGVKEI